MTRILVQRGSSGGSSSNTSRSSSTRAESQVTTAVVSTARVEESDEIEEQVVGDELLESYGTSDDSKAVKGDDLSLNSDKHETSSEEIADIEKAGSGEITASREFMKGLRISERVTCDNEDSSGDSLHGICGTSHPPPPPIPPPKPSVSNLNSRRVVSSNSNSPRIGPSRRAVVWPVVSRTSPTESRPSSPRSHESEGYNSADEQNPCFVSSYYDIERERQFEIDIRRAKGLEVKRMIQDGNCLFRAVADQVYGDSEAYDLVRQMCIDYMERERDHFSQFITEGFISYCKRKRRDKQRRT